jgi:geranylgeranyl diphosphate synthase, type II
MSDAGVESRVKALLGEVKALVEGDLDRWLPEVSDGTRLAEGMRYSTLAGGKRVRPALCLLTCEALGGRRDRALAAACALELIHVYSLVHDDLPAMDDDDLRRGKPTNHKVFGEALAILVGDGLQARAFEVLSEAYADDSTLALGLVRELAEAAGARGMVGGQAMDMVASEPGATGGDEGSLERIHRHKTGALLRASVLMGARCAGLTPASDGWAVLDGYSCAVGLAFQVADDILDCTATTEELGKTAGKDVEQDKLTYVALLGLDGARAKAKALEAQALECLSGLGAAADPLRDLATFIVSRVN